MDVPVIQVTVRQGFIDDTRGSYCMYRRAGLSGDYKTWLEGSSNWPRCPLVRHGGDIACLRVENEMTLVIGGLELISLLTFPYTTEWLVPAHMPCKNT